ncbi:MAG TPA: nucleotide exchange factor GrpE [Ilumatobacteraceae bacterium]|nr:nucleotide exchange factor GrpE [Ilumatobacteraceae bacterium]
MVDPPAEQRRDGAASPSDASNDDLAGGGDAFDDLTERVSDVVDDLDGDLDDVLADDVDYSDVDVPALLAEREEYKGLAQRIQADFDNYRKRAAANSLAEADRASGRLAEALLPVLDAAEAAFLRHPDEIGPLLNQMLVELKKHGLETLDLENQPFDPEFAEAVAHEPGDGGEPIVSEVLRSGYTWKGKVLRAAMVKTKD